MRFADRKEAGRALGARLAAAPPADPVVLALPRGGLPVALEVARALKAPLDIVLVRKIGVPAQPELAAAAIVDGETPELVLNEEVMRRAGLRRADLEPTIARETAEIERRRALYRPHRAPVPLAGRDLILVDDGIATGTTVRAAVRALKRRAPASLVIATPVAPPDTIAALAREVDAAVCLETPERFMAIGQFYRDFHQVSDDEVTGILDDAG